jgi:hypothetical protein
MAFMAAMVIFDTVNSCAANAFKNNDVLHGLVEGIVYLAEKHPEVLEDFCNFVHDDLLIRAASPLMIREIMCDAAENELNYAMAITPKREQFP